MSHSTTFYTIALNNNKTSICMIPKALFLLMINSKMSLHSLQNALIFISFSLHSNPEK